MEIFEPEQKAMKEVTMSMYPGATCKDAHWTSFFDIAGVANAAPLDDKDSSGESDSDEESEQYIGLSVIVPTIQLSLHTCMQDMPPALNQNLLVCSIACAQNSNSNSRFTGPSSTRNHSATMRSASPEKHASSSKLEPAGLPNYLRPKFYF
jgi:hypothetical protein